MTDVTRVRAECYPPAARRILNMATARIMITTAQIEQPKAKPRRRVLAALAAAALFGLLFVLPLCNALMLCSMPCCHPGDEGGILVATSGTTGCAAECAIAAEQATQAEVTSLAPEKSTERSSPPVLALVCLPLSRRVTPPVERDSGAVHPGTDAPLHVLHSVFRI